MVILSAPACHLAPLAARPPAACAWEGSRATRWQVGWSTGTKWGFPAASSLPRLSSCRCCYLVGPGSLSLTRPWDALVGLPGKLLLPGPCCLAVTRGASRQVPRDALVGPPGKLLLPGPCLLGLNTLFLNGSKGTTEDLGGRPASLATGRCNCPCTSSGY